MQQPPYAASIKAGGFKYELDCERMIQSDTWALATPRQRPYLLMLNFTAWQQTPCGSLPCDDAIIAARLGIDLATFEQDKAILLRGWKEASDGRLYHPVLTDLVLEMMSRKAGNAQRQAAYRQRRQSAGQADDKRETDEGVTRYSGVSDSTTTTTTTTKDTSSLRSDVGAKRAKTPSRTPTHTAIRPDSVPEQVWQDFLKLRDKHRAPLTDTALAGIEREAAKAGISLAQAMSICCERGWRGFNAGWDWNPQTRPKGGASAGSDNRYAAAAAAIFDGATHV
jgi:hypothetical protein